MSKDYGLEELVADYGYDDVTEMLEDFGDDSIMPAICTSCGATYEYEPDCSDGYCDACEAKTVQSLFILLSII